MPEQHGRRGSWRPSLDAVAVCAALLCSGAGLLSQQGGGTSAAAPFHDVASDAGVDFVHVNDARGELLLPEVIGAGGALFDYDNDGDLDLLAVQSGTPAVHPGSAASHSRLYRNDLDRSGGRLRFTDVTTASRLATAGYGMGAATGDIDNDGWIDVYVTALGSNQLFRNRGDGTFEDITKKSGTDDPRWSTSATFFDYDRDGRLDLFVANYVQYSSAMKRACFSASSARDYCNPAVYAAAAHSLFRNTGDGTFTDVSAASRIGRTTGRGLGVVGADLNADGWLDLFVANDGDPNLLWLNDQGKGTFREGALLAGLAVNRMGQAQGSMGIDVGDVDGDGDDDLFVTNLDNEGNTLYRNVGKGLFEDRATEAGLGGLGWTGFGTRFVDYDNDGWLDLVVANGAVRHLAAQVRAKDPYPLRQRNQLFRNDRGRRFQNVTESAGAAFQPLHVGRGLATGDLDNDGDVDLVIFNNNGPARVLMNDLPPGRPWIGVRVVDSRYRRDALQARVVLAGEDARDVVRRVQVDGSYATASDPRIVFGLGGRRSAPTIRVHWPGGGVEEFSGLTPGRYWILEAGRPPRPQ